MTTTGVTGVEVSFFTACRGLEFDGYLHMKILEILPSVLDRFMANYSSRALDKKEKWEPSFLESSCDHILPEQISWEFPARAAWIFLQDKHEWTIPGGDPWKRTPPPLPGWRQAEGSALNSGKRAEVPSGWVSCPFSLSSFCTRPFPPLSCFRAFPTLWQTAALAVALNLGV